MKVNSRPVLPEAEGRSVHKVADALLPLLVPLDELTLLPGNPRKGDVAAVMRSLSKFGQRKPVTAQPDGTVTAGNHTVLAARKLRWTHIAALRTDDDDLTAKAWALADNRTADLATYDHDALAAMLQAVSVDGGLLEAASYSEKDLLKFQDQGTRSTLFTLIDVAMGEPLHVVEHGQVWRMGVNRLVVAHVMRDWPVWTAVLQRLERERMGAVAFYPYPGLYMALVESAVRFVAVWDDPYFAGHVLDKYSAVHGIEAVELL